MKNYFGNFVINKSCYVYILLGFIINLCFGFVYLWSVFRKLLE